MGRFTDLSPFVDYAWRFNSLQEAETALVKAIENKKKQKLACTVKSYEEIKK